MKHVKKFNDFIFEEISINDLKSKTKKIGKKIKKGAKATLDAISDFGYHVGRAEVEISKKETKKEKEKLRRMSKNNMGPL